MDKTGEWGRAAAGAVGIAEAEASRKVQGL